MENGKIRLQRAQDDVEEVRVIMQDNLNKAYERAGNLKELEEQAEELQQKAKTFEELTFKLKRKNHKEPPKINVKLVVVVVVVVFVIIIIFITILLATGVISTSSTPHPTVAPTSKP